MDKSIIFNIPDGYEKDEEKSTGTVIYLKKIDNEVKTWNDLKGIKVPDSSCYIDTVGNIMSCDGIIESDIYDRNLFIDEKHAKSALAMAQISQLMPYYGEQITDEEWKDSCINKYTIEREMNNVHKTRHTTAYQFIAFHTEEQRNKFLKNNYSLVEDYLMLS